MAERITIGGALAQDWINSGALNLIADPAGNLEAPIYYDRIKKNNGYIFDANDRDLLIRKDPDHKPPFGIGVYTAKAPIRFVGSPQETEIGYYPSLGEADTLSIELAKPLTNTQVTVSLFYADESYAPEQLTYQPYYKGVPVYDPVTVTASGTSYYTKNNAGFFTFDLAGDSAGPAKIDKIVFSSPDVPDIKDGSDYLVENISGDGVPRLQISNTSAPNLVWPTRTYTFDYRETNIGNGDSVAHSTGFFLSTDETLDASDTLLGTAAEEALGAYQSRTVSPSITLPDNLAIGNYYLIYQTDVNNVVDEQNESNDAELDDPLNTGAIRTEPIEMNGYVKQTFDLNYSASDQSIWDTGSISDNRFLGVEWNTGNQEASIGISDYRAGVRGSSSGKIGLQSNLEVSGGSVNASLPIDLWLEVPNKVQAGDTVTIKSGFTLDPNASFSSTGLTAASFGLDGILNFQAQASAFLGGLDYAFNLPSIDTNQQLFNYDFETDVPDQEFLLGPNNEGKLTLSYPQLNSTDNASDGTLFMTPQDNVASVDFNFAQLAANILGIPLRDSGSYSVPLPIPSGFLSINASLDYDWTALFAGLKAYLSLKQELALSPDSLTGQLTLENGEKHNFTVGQDLTFTVPEGIGNSLNFSANLNLGASVSNKTSLGYDLNGEIEALKASATARLEVKPPDVWDVVGVKEVRKWVDTFINFVSGGYWETVKENVYDWVDQPLIKKQENVSFGPLVDLSGSILKDDIPLYQDSFALNGLGSQSFNYSIPTVV